MAARARPQPVPADRAPTAAPRCGRLAGGRGGHRMTKVAIITGASSGIGAASAVELARRGWSVVINYARSEAAAAEVAAKCSDAITVKADIAEDEDCKRLAQAALDRWG